MDPKRLRRLQRKPRRWGRYVVLLILLIAWFFRSPSPEPIPAPLPAQTQNEVKLEIPVVRSPTKLILSVCPALAQAGGKPHLISEILQATGDSTIDFDLEPELLFAVMAAESQCRTTARSKKGALGLMQLTRKTASALRIANPESIEENIRGGAKYLRAMLVRFEGNLPLALAAYNAGPGAIERYGSLPPYVETQTFVRRVLQYYRKMQKS